MKVNVFRKDIRDYYLEHKRAFPWRATGSLSSKTRAYRVLVSEIMLQQTQAERVIPKYQMFVKRFPTIMSLANAEFQEVLAQWQGLGYNRRARMLHNAARQIMKEHQGEIPKDEKTLTHLPGIGPYTAGAIRAFAYNLPAIIIETNIRSVFIHFFFSRTAQVKDSDIIPLIEKTLDRKNVAEWYSALMDYGSMLKKKEKNPSRRSSHYKKQSPFKNSNREVRGVIVRTLVEKKYSISALTQRLKLYGKKRVLEQLHALSREEIVTVKRGFASVA
ncbi:A/G-specific adenine glycosylase [Candidatus Kaiserbacteria bacterium]|nr:A/G-specific adenine glycosylase [Candidatus Kaiserbacteria bacterium]